VLEEQVTMRRRGAVWLAWGICGIPLVLVALIWLLHTKNAAVPLPPGGVPGFSSPLFDAGVLLVFSLPAALIVSRQPHNPIGWLLVAIGYGVGIGAFASEYGFYAVVTAPGSLPAGIPVLWFADIVPFWLTFASVALLLLLFPDGHLPSRAWRPVAWAALASITLSLASSALYPRNLGGDPRLPHNPTGIRGWEKVDNVTSLTALLFFALLLVCLVAVGGRFRRARGVERQQLKWFASGAAALVLTSIAFVPLLWGGLDALVLVGFALFTTCVAVAMLRYRLYDIDRLINRTLVYGLLTALLAGIYAGLVLVLGQAFGGLGTEPPSWAVAGATLAVAALFQPARRRIQQAVDQRFNRRRYDAAKTIEAFAARLREEVDLDSLTAELLAVVNQTMQPTRVSLWLRSATSTSQDHGDSVAHRPASGPIGASQSRRRGL
jgi:hypothetical protein